MNLANKVLIRVGHPAYQGANAVRLCFSKAQAIRVLRNRGIKRDDARKAIEQAVLDGSSTVKPNILDQIEVHDHNHRAWDGYYAEDRSTILRKWAGAAE